MMKFVVLILGAFCLGALAESDDTNDFAEKLLNTFLEIENDVEKEVGTLLSLHKPAMQSSTRHNRASASRVVDGNIDRRSFKKRMCSQTEKERGAWWQVDLGKSYEIKHVTIYTSRRIRNFAIHVADNKEMHNFKVCTTHHDKARRKEAVRLSCNGNTVGRFVRIQIMDRDKLSLCQVQVYGVPANANCLGAKSGRIYDYSGTKSVTVSGHTCQRWDATSPVNPASSIRDMGHAALGAMVNYCRQPSVDPEDRPWCYTSKAPNGRWEYCDIPTC